LSLFKGLAVIARGIRHSPLPAPCHLRENTYGTRLFKNQFLLALFSFVAKRASPALPSLSDGRNDLGLIPI
jgi:hypothetical protein